ncbi:hypothetical protein SC1083_0774 [Aggregatibacter actinomycetemcomitans serotype e str. SC1083]|uniref:Uncharacterized protein n=1 Tax=Aggregatibacter actinomycetemcomitans serotype e str. SC1083 TaxID=907488 RepID=G4A7H8_AGGAC|nr:hypothetical protein SC1083_0774 [Aggregatibacter actinomycetemcomitans serotype e str. SC1083]
MYNTEFLDIRFVEDGRKDSVVKSLPLPHPLRRFIAYYPN